MKNRITNIENKVLWNTCHKCWLKINTSESKVWIEKNRKAQLIAQNKPEQKIKNSKRVSESWTYERKIKNSKLLKDRWKNDKDFAEKALKNLSWTNKLDVSRFNTLLKSSIGIGGLKGIYNNIRYDSSLELSFILWCFDNSIDVRRYDLDPIRYLDENNISRLYIPDFIITNNIIVEIKGFGIYYQKNFDRNIKKFQALKSWCKSNNFNNRLLLGDDLILKKNYKRARKLHHENKKENAYKIQW